jgi:PAS domain S-box-containing protein
MTSPPDFAALFTASPYPYLLIDTGFVIIGANPAYLRATGRTADDIVGKHIFDAFPANPADPDSTNLNEVRTSIELAISTQKPHTSALLRYAIPLETPEGTVFEERFWSAVHSPVFDENGKVAFVAQNAIDVTDLYRFDNSAKKYYLKQDANAVPDVSQMNRPQMHEAMTRILNVERNQLQILFNQAPGFIAVLTGKEHVFEIANEAFYQLVGHRDIIGKPAMVAVPEMAGQGFKELLDGAFEAGKPVVLLERKARLQREIDGPLEDRYVDLLYQPIFGKDGRVTGIFVQGHDVTLAYDAKYALAEKVQQLEEAKSRQAFLLELADRIRPLSNAEEVTVVACELLGKYLGANRVNYGEVDDSAERLTMNPAWTDGTLSSMTGMQLILNDFGPLLADALRAGQMLVIDDVITNEHSAPYASAYAVNGVRSLLAIPLMKEGRLWAILSVHCSGIHDWTDTEIAMANDMVDRAWSAVESARAQAGLQIERDRSQSIFDGMTECYMLLARDFTVLEMNAEGLRIAYRTRAEVIGKNHWEVWPEAVGTEGEKMYRQAMETRMPGTLEYQQTFSNGHTVWFELRAYPAGEDQLAVFARDITERKAAEEKLKDADRRKDEFLAMLAHELRNPLAPIGAAAQLLQMAKLDDAQVRHTSQIIGRQVDHMTHLIDDLLDVSRVTRGKIALENTSLDIRHIVTDAVEQVTPLMQSRRHHLALHLPPDTAMVIGDKKRLVQVIANILNNAAKYTNEGGNILLKTDLRKSNVLIEVVDNGIGMAPDLAEHAFDLFAQAERSSDRSAGGLGLGLALVKSLVELHGGAVTCESDGIGKGSKFTVCLPRIVAPGGPVQHQLAGSSMQPSTKSLRIMVVDDNVDAAAMLAMLLETMGHHVLVEHGSRRALERARAETPDVCLLDIGLPEMDGNELAQHLRAQPETAKSILIAVTGYGQENDRKRTLAAGFDHHLVKPVDIQKLTSILTEVYKVKQAMILPG